MVKNNLDLEISYKDVEWGSKPYKDMEPDLQGWNSNGPIFEELISELKPNLIIEVGTWKGASAIHMGELLKKYRLESKIVCVDTWLGALEMWLDKTDKDRYLSLDLKGGYPQLYYQFLFNVLYSDMEDIIIPFPQTSLIAARYFKKKKVEADMIYIDASHDYQDVLADLEAYWPLLKKGGVILGDDWNTWIDVQKAVLWFWRTEVDQVEIKDNHYWMVRK